MITQPFEYFAPTTLQQALELLEKHGAEAKVLAGGQSLIPLMNLNLAAPAYVVDINRLKELAFIKEAQYNIRIGALTRHYELASSEAIRWNCFMLAEAAHHIGDMHVRHRGTIGGAICHADPAGDYLPVLTAANALFEARSLKGNRQIRVVEFFEDMFTTALGSNELLTEILIPKLPEHAGSAYVKLEFVSGGFAIVGAAAVVELASDKSCKRIALSLGGVERKPILLSGLGEQGVKLDSALIEKIGEAAFSSVKRPLSDIHADGEYRRAMARVLAKRAVFKALMRAGGKPVG